MSFTAEKLTRYTELSKRIRRHIVRMTHHAGSGHPGGSLSATELLTVLFFEHMNVDPKNPDWADRDCFSCPKGIVRRFTIRFWPRKVSFRWRS